MNKKGISLITLAITILVMAILTAVIVMTTNNSGIIKNSKDTVNATNLSQVRELAHVAWVNAQMEGKETQAELETSVKSSLTSAGIDITKYDIVVTVDGVSVNGNSTNTGDNSSGETGENNNGTTGGTDTDNDSGTEATNPNLPADTATVIYNANNLSTSVTYTNFTLSSSNYSKIGYAVGNTSLVVPAAFKEGNTWYKIVEIAAETFCEHTTLEEIILPDTLTTIGDTAFAMSGLTDIVIPDSVTSLGGEVFPGSSLKTIVIGNGVTTLKASLFEQCAYLTTVTIGKGVKTIDAWVFQGCNKLTTVNYTGTQSEWNAISINDSTLKTLTINYNYTK